MSLSSLDQTAAQPYYGAAYAELRRTIIAAGLLERKYGYYLAHTAFCFLLLLVSLALPFLFPATSGWSILESILLGFAMVQIGLIGHDAGHLEIFRKTAKNWLLGQLCWSIVTGISFWYWNDRHNRHHGHTNDLDEDPDIRGGGPLAVAFTEEEAAARHGWRRTLVKYQVVLVLLGLLLYTLAFRAEGWLFADGFAARIDEQREGVGVLDPGGDKAPAHQGERTYAVVQPHDRHRLGRRDVVAGRKIRLLQIAEQRPDGFRRRGDDITAAHAIIPPDGIYI